MSDDNRKEELKAQINEKLDQLSVEELEQVAGGWTPASVQYVCMKCNASYSLHPGTCSKCGSKEFAALCC
ncbi:MAG: hypothetical protein IJ747_07470 [Lachnospiraceae bacterium]|nr:hypothetical protein [Lachnospiraceae bacterium]MBR1853223.1 hypothetical protein [Lachnospiraceae bacterium]